jgi:hypothetical protein
MRLPFLAWIRAKEISAGPHRDDDGKGARFTVLFPGMTTDAVAGVPNPGTTATSASSRSLWEEEGTLFRLFFRFPVPRRWSHVILVHKKRIVMELPIDAVQHRVEGMASCRSIC